MERQGNNFQPTASFPKNPSGKWKNKEAPGCSGSLLDMNSYDSRIAGIIITNENQLYDKLTTRLLPDSRHCRQWPTLPYPF